MAYTASADGATVTFASGSDFVVDQNLRSYSFVPNGSNTSSETMVDGTVQASAGPGQNKLVKYRGAVYTTNGGSWWQYYSQASGTPTQWSINSSSTVPWSSKSASGTSTTPTGTGVCIIDTNLDVWLWGAITSGTRRTVTKNGVPISGTDGQEQYFDGAAVYYKDGTPAWHVWNGSAFVSSADPTSTTPLSQTWAFCSAGSGSFQDAAGNTYSVTAGGVMEEGSNPLNGGSGTSMAALLAGSVYGQDSGSGNWYLWNASGNVFVGPQGPSPDAVTVTDGTGFSILINNKIVTLTGIHGQVAFNGTTDGTTSNVVTMFPLAGVLYYQDTTPAWHKNTTNTAGAWASAAGDPRSGGSPLAESADGTSITPGSGTIVDANGNIWTVTSGGQAAENGIVNTTTSAVTEGYYTGHTFYIKSTNTNSLGLSPGWWSANPTTGIFTDSQDPTAGGGSGGHGPTVSGTVTVDFSTQVSVGGTAQTVSKFVWGVSTSALGDSNFAACADTTLQPVLNSLAFPLYRFNVGGSMDAIYPSGATSCTSAAKAATYGNLINNFNTFIPSGARIIITLSGSPGTNWSSSTNFAAAVSDLVTWFNTTNSTGTGSPMPIYGFEFGNENNLSNGSEPTWEHAYFNAAAAAVHTVNSSWKRCGPTYSWNASLAAFGGGTTNNCDVLDYHAYRVGPTNPPVGSPGYVSAQTNWTNDGGVSSMLTSTILSAIGTDYSNYTGGGGTASELFIGEYNDNDTYGTNSGGLEPGILNTYQQNAAMPVFIANNIKSGLDSTTKFTMAGIWSCWSDSDYGVVGGSDNVNGGGSYTVSPAGYFLSKAAAVMYGPRYTVTLGGSVPATFTALAVAGGPGTNNLGVLLINGSATTAVNNYSVALSKMPGVVSGNTTCNLYEISPANPAGKLTTGVPVTNGVVQVATVPASSTVFLYI